MKRSADIEEIEPYTVQSSFGEARAVWVTDPKLLPRALEIIGLTLERPTLVLIGGADGLADRELAGLRPLFADVLAPLCERQGWYVLDGGTDTGVMRLMGEARASSQASFTLVGVAAEGTVNLPITASIGNGVMSLEPRHTHFVLVPGSGWGDEAPWLAQVATVLAGDAPSVTLLVNGGEIALHDARRSLEAGRPVLALAGTGRMADALANSLRTGKGNGDIETLTRTGMVSAISMYEPEALARALQECLREGPDGEREVP